MAETAQPQNKKTKAAAKSAIRLDFATLLGIALAVAGILGGLLLEKGSVQDITQGTALMIVMGGTFGAVLITTPLPILVRAFKGLGAVFLERTESTSAAIETLVQFATKARKNGIVSLE